MQEAAPPTNPSPVLSRTSSLQSVWETHHAIILLAAPRKPPVHENIRQLAYENLGNNRGFLWTLSNIKKIEIRKLGFVGLHEISRK